MSTLQKEIANGGVSESLCSMETAPISVKSKVNSSINGRFLTEIHI